MSSKESICSTDLAGIIVGETAISDVQGDIGLLSYRGIDIKDLVGVPFLHVVWMVLFGEWPNEQQKSRLKAFMCRHTRLSHAEINLLQQVSRDLHPMLMLQGLVPLLTLTHGGNPGCRPGCRARPVSGSQDFGAGRRPSSSQPEQGYPAAGSRSVVP